MKKILILILTLSLGMLSIACGGDKKAFSESKAAYDKVDYAYKITEKIGEDIYEAWRIGIYDEENINVTYLASELNLSEEELIEGIVYTFMEFTYDKNYENSTEEDKQYLRDSADIYFTMFKDEMFSACVKAVIGAYVVNGRFSEVETALEEAKVQMKNISESYSDYEHYPNLKSYYTTTSSFFEFCKMPTGSFEQVKETINDYRNEARDYISDLEFVFE